MLNSDENRKKIISKFPKLIGDKDFKVVDYPSPNYNCFAWAANHKDVFWQPIPLDKRPFQRFDGVSFDWPFVAAEDTKLSTMIMIFSKLGYIECLDGAIEEGYRKVALYGTEEEVTHAARQLVNGKDKGKWTSKLGPSFEIIHGDPTSIEGKDYGPIIKYLRMPFP
jgi:hypothetical protein